MKHLAQALIAMLAVVAMQAFAGPMSYDGKTSTTDGTYYDAGPLLLGDTITFDAWWEVLNPVASGSPWPTLNLNVEIGGLPFIFNFSRNSSTGTWEPYSAPLANNASSFIGTMQTIRFKIDDFGQGTDTTVWIRNVVSAVPEPGTLSLLCAGLLGLAMLRLRRRSA